MRYSPSTLAFYPEDTDTVKYDKPDDLTHVTDDQYAEIMAALKEGSRVAIEDEQLVITPIDTKIVEDRNKTFALRGYQQNIQALLDKTDLVCLRCYKSSVPFPADWADWCKYLRAELTNKSADPSKPIPSSPPYPKGS